MDEQFLFVQWLNLLDPGLRFLVEVIITYQLRVLLVHHWIAHFPNGNRAALEEPFNTVLIVLEVELRTSAISRFGLKYSLFYPSIG